MCLFFLLRGAIVLDNNPDEGDVETNDFKCSAYNMYSEKNQWYDMDHKLIELEK